MNHYETSAADVTCKGSYMFNSACGSCRRCMEELAKMKHSCAVFESMTPTEPMTDEDKANAILSSFSWTSKIDGSPLEVIASVLREQWNEALEEALDAAEDYDPAIGNFNPWQAAVDIRDRIRALKKP